MGTAKKILGIDELKKFIGVLEENMSADARKKVLKKIGSRITNEVIPDYFQEKKGPNGEKWADLKDPYKGQKIKKKGTTDILVSEGKLLRSVGYKENENQVVVGAGDASDVPYARSHNNGYKERNLEARQFIGIGEEEQQRIDEEIYDWWGRVIK
ncbi:MAG: phage virion morphogenesis protein [Spirochaetes bacterium GWD1_27_9]|nr:MAG: phage virion morphogenesis protein [Spirochaetes bacterium GWB1_27_13]OHD45282.1 MAG: phage virion morphogenesis protein [Spirochaetes bacterium GWD1_27_9]